VIVVKRDAIFEKYPNWVGFGCFYKNLKRLSALFSTEKRIKRR
jgi:hypothetical protein